MPEPGIISLVGSGILTAGKFFGRGKSDQERCLEKVQREAVRKCIDQVDLRLGGINPEQREQIKKQCQSEVRRNPGVINAAECTLEAGIADCTRETIRNCLDGVFETPDPLDDAQMPTRPQDPGIIRKIPSDVTNVFEIIQARAPIRTPVEIPAPRRGIPQPGTPPVVRPADPEPLPGGPIMVPPPGERRRTLPDNLPIPIEIPPLPKETRPDAKPTPKPPPAPSPSRRTARPTAPEIQPPRPTRQPEPVRRTQPARPSPQRPQIEPQRPQTPAPAPPRPARPPVRVPAQIPAAIGVAVGAGTLIGRITSRAARTSPNVPRPFRDPQQQFDQLRRPRECPPCEKDEPEKPRDVCVEGFYRERSIGTDFEPWAERDCSSGEYLRDLRRNPKSLVERGLDFGIEQVRNLL